VSEDWTIRSAVPEDEACLASMWLRSLSFSRAAQAYGLEHVRDPASTDRQAWWGLNQPIVTGLLRRAVVTVACDLERAEHRPGEPAVILGWSVTDERTVYGAGVKNSLIRAGYGEDVARALLGDKLQAEQRYAMDLVDLWRLRMVPALWSDGTSWWSTMVWLVEQSLDGGASRDVAHHITDPEREWWRPAA
jgi:hypothetical protein